MPRRRKQAFGSTVVLTVLCLTAILALAGEATITGPARVVGGDTFFVEGRIIRLYGVDAPEVKQQCLTEDGTSWACGSAATAYLRALIGQDQVECEFEDRDRYGRVVASCRVGGRLIAAALLQNGWAVAYRKYLDAERLAVYLEHEAQASKAARGIWRGTFMLPWEWRRANR